MYKPHNFRFWPDDELWKLLFAEYTNYFRRNGTPIPLAVTLFNISKADLLRLIVDYAEIANVQEPSCSKTPQSSTILRFKVKMDRVSMEVENLERAFTDVDVEQLKAIEPLVKAQAILKPVFEHADFEWTDDVAAEILTKVEHLDPSPELQITAGTEGTRPRRSLQPVEFKEEGRAK
jgi:hypothetical protein